MEEDVPFDLLNLPDSPDYIQETCESRNIKLDEDGPDKSNTKTSGAVPAQLFSTNDITYDFSNPQLFQTMEASPQIEDSLAQPTVYFKPLQKKVTTSTIRQSVNQNKAVNCQIPVQTPVSFDQQQTFLVAPAPQQQQVLKINAAKATPRTGQVVKVPFAGEKIQPVCTII